MRTPYPVIGSVLILAGLAILFLLRDTVVRLIIFVLEFLGVLAGVILVIAGVSMLLGGRWGRRRSRTVRQVGP